MRWLIVGALGVEIRPLLWRMRDVQPLGSRIHRGRHPTAAHVELTVLRCGVGPIKAQQRTSDAIRQWRPDAVLSMGTCGALVDSLSIGDVRTVESSFIGTESVSPLTPLRDLEVVSLSTVDEPCWTPERRQELARVGAEIVEMEAAAVARAVREFDPAIPVHAVKIVSDQAGARPDPVIGAGAIPSPLRIARFRFRALKLSHQALVPAVLPVLTQSG